MWRPRDEESLGHRKGAVHRVPVEVLDVRQRMMRLSQEAITEKIDRLKRVGDEGRSHRPGRTGFRDVTARQMSLFICVNRLMSRDPGDGRSPFSSMTDSYLYPVTCGLRASQFAPARPSRGLKLSISRNSTAAPASTSATSTTRPSGRRPSAAPAAHEDHGDIGDVDHRHAVMPCPAR